ncbi:uncharacterized protein LOC119911218 [Micropterus salmoides]|uniref:uncharacterized protein LOC119911218 n=1 Tax=Micropterus salmoides TaxID=27706 RepID=UPI0018EAF56F|nr:uncharacterized protein LOC119911218 [Micropterus salmoides]
MLKRGEMLSTKVPHLIPQREEDQQQEDQRYPSLTSRTEIMSLKDNFMKLITCRYKKQLFKQIMTLFSNVNNELVIRHGDMEFWSKTMTTINIKGDKQFAYAVVEMKNGTSNLFHAVCPYYRDKKSKNSASPSTEVTSHSEEILMRQIDEFLPNNGTNVQSILIYTLNSPCLKRKKHIKPCMFKLLEMADQWLSKYGFFTYVAFTKFWGLKGPNYFVDLKYSDISSPSSCFYPYVETYKEIPFKLNTDYFNKNIFLEIYQTISTVKDTQQRKKLNGDIKSCLEKFKKLAENSVNLTKDQHVACAVKIISSLAFHPLVHDTIIDILTKNWNEIVNYSSILPIIEQITTDFNTAVVHLFLKDLNSTLGNRSPLRPYQVPRAE